jgi:hypothetical protein
VRKYHPELRENQTSAEILIAEIFIIILSLVALSISFCSFLTMRSFSILLLLALVGAAVAFIRPAQPVQVDNGVPAFAVNGKAGLDNLFIVADKSIHPARKCTYFCGVELDMSVP